MLRESHARLLLFVVAAMALYCLPASAQKTAVDPNAGSRPAQKLITDADTRLSQKITYEARHKLVSEILSELTKNTGVTFRAGQNKNDWQVRDRKMNIFARDVTLAGLMNSIARVMKFKWSINRDTDPWTYRLFMDRKTLLDAEAQKARSDARIQEKLTQRRQKLLDLFTNAADSTNFAGCVGTLCRDIPGLAEAIATGQQLTISGSQLSAAGKNAVQEMLEKNHDETPAPGLAGGIDNALIWVNLGHCMDESRDPSLLAQVLFLCGNQSYGGTISESEVEDSDYNSDLMPDTKDWQDKLKNPNTSSSDKSEIADKLSDAMTAWDREGCAPGEPFTEHPEDPALTKKIKLQPKSTMLQDVQCALAETSGFAVVSDCFGKTDVYGGVNSEEVEIKTLLDKITKPCLYNWDKHGSVIEFRDRHWFSKRSAQIPESQIEAWRQAFKKNETLNIAELAMIAELTAEQFNTNIKEDEVLCSNCASDSSSLSAIMMLQQDVLRAYAALTEDKCKALFSPSGLSISVLSPDQRALVEKPINRTNPKFLLSSNAQITLTAKGVQKGKQFDYTLTVTTSDSLESIVWRFTSPKYEPPKDFKIDDKSSSGPTPTATESKH